MTTQASPKIYKIFESIKNTEYKGSVRCRHFSVAIKNGRVITPIGYNYHRTYVFGSKRGTLHAEMNPLSYLMNMLYKSYGRYKHSLSLKQYISRHELRNCIKEI